MNGRILFVSHTEIFSGANFTLGFASSLCENQKSTTEYPKRPFFAAAFAIFIVFDVSLTESTEKAGCIVANGSCAVMNNFSHVATTFVSVLSARNAAAGALLG
jgi:hypothetical protein